MRGIATIGFLALLVAAAASGWCLDYLSLARELALALLVLLACFLLWRGEERRVWARYVVALAIAGFVNISRIGAPVAPALGPWGFWALHLGILFCFSFYFVRILTRVSNADANSEDVTALDFWLINLAFFCFAAIWLAEILRLGVRPATLLSGLRRAVQILTLAALFLLSVKYLHATRRERVAAVVLVCALCLTVALGATRFLRIEILLQRAARQLSAGQRAAAQEAASAAERDNGKMGWPPFDLRAREIRRDLFCATQRYDLALKEMTEYLLQLRKREMVRASFLRSAYSATPELFEFFKRYLQPVPLAPLLEKYNSLQQARFFLDIHDGSARNVADDAILLLLFLRKGFLDRLWERYATSGFPEMADLAAYEDALDSFSLRQPARAAEAQFLVGVVRFRTGDYPGSLEAFRKVLEAQPDHANAITYVERLAAIQGQTDLLSTIRGRSRRIAPEMMQGNRRWGFNVDDTLWTALEVNPGRYGISLSVRGTPALGVAPQLSVFLGNTDKPLFQGTISSTDWTTVTLQETFASEGCHRFLLSFDNDFYGRNSQGVLENRNLEFRGAGIERLADR